jgi:hypothetical protein
LDSSYAALEKSIAALLNVGGISRRLRGGFQILQVGLAISATDLFDMKLDVLGRIIHHGPQQIASQLFARWAREPIPAPNISYGMNSRLSLGNQCG